MADTDSWETADESSLTEGLKAVNLKEAPQDPSIRLAQREAPASGNPDEPDHFVLSCLGNVDDRETIHNMDYTLEEFVNSSSTPQYTFRNVSSHQYKMLQHLARGFNLDCALHGSDVLLTKTRDSRVPVFRFGAVRHQGPNTRETRAATPAQPKIQIMRRDPAKAKGSGRGNGAAESKPKEQTIEEREEAYNRARERIFANSTPSTTSASASVSNTTTNSGQGERKMKAEIRNKNVPPRVRKEMMDDSWEYDRDRPGLVVHNDDSMMMPRLPDYYGFDYMAPQFGMDGYHNPEMAHPSFNMGGFNQPMGPPSSGGFNGFAAGRGSGMPPMGMTPMAPYNNYNAPFNQHPSMNGFSGGIGRGGGGAGFGMGRGQPQMSYGIPQGMPPGSMGPHGGMPSYPDQMPHEGSYVGYEHHQQAEYRGDPSPGVDPALRGGKSGKGRQRAAGPQADPRYNDEFPALG